MISQVKIFTFWTLSTVIFMAEIISTIPKTMKRENSDILMRINLDIIYRAIICNKNKKY